jgi:cytochrome P450 family 142 subfamily A polypeptide 1
VNLVLLDRSFYAEDPFPTLATLRATEPVYRDETGMWALLRHADVVWAERHPELLSSAQGSRPRSFAQPSMIDSDDPVHKRRRGIVDRGFHPRPIAEEERRIRAITGELIDAVAARGECDLVLELAAPLPMIVIGDMLGTPPSERELLQHWSDVMIRGADGPENATADVLEAYSGFVDLMNEIIEERKRNPGDDLISKLVQAHPDEDQLSHDEIIGESLLLLIGGNETTRNVISGGLEALMRFPDQKQKLLDDPAKIPDAVEECLRWVTPVINMARTATTDIELRGTMIPEGDQVLLMYSSANRDEEVFDRPDEFDVARTPNPHLAFGHSAHFCLGASLARLEIRVMLEEVLLRLPKMRLADPEATVARTHSSFIRGITGLPVVF